MERIGDEGSTILIPRILVWLERRENIFRFLFFVSR